MIEDQRMYVNVETVFSKNQNPMGKHIHLHEVYGDHTGDCSTISHLATHCCKGCISINNDLNINTEHSIKLPIDILQDYQATCEKI